MDHIITHEEYTKAKEIIEAYEKQLEYTINAQYAWVYKNLKAFMLAKKESGRLGEWDSVHHEEVLNKMLELENQVVKL